MKKNTKNKLTFNAKHFWILLSGLTLIISGFGILWLNNSFKPSDVAVRAFASDSKVSTSSRDYLVLTPTSEQKKVGVIIYPGARIQALAYATLARRIAENGYLTVIVPMPFNLANLDPFKGKLVMDDYPTISDWVVVGHSLGGTMATRLAYADHRVSGLVLLAALPEDNVDLFEADIPTTTLIGTNDALLSIADVESTIKRLPVESKLFKIEGGNHSYFADFGLHPEDTAATISWEEQQFITLQEILKVLSLFE